MNKSVTHHSGPDELARQSPEKSGNQIKATKFRLCEQQNQKEASLLSKENVRDGCLSHISEYTTMIEPIRFAYLQNVRD